MLTLGMLLTILLAVLPAVLWYLARRYNQR